MCRRYPAIALEKTERAWTGLPEAQATWSATPDPPSSGYGLIGSSVVDGAFAFVSRRMNNWTAADAFIVAVLLGAVVLVVWRLSRLRGPAATATQHDNPSTDIVAEAEEEGLGLRSAISCDDSITIRQATHSVTR